MKKTHFYASAVMLAVVSPVMAQVQNVSPTMPRLDPVIQDKIIWGAAILFPLLILIIAFKAPKRTFHELKK